MIELSKDDVKAIRQANRIIVRFKENTQILELVKENRTRTDVFTTRDGDARRIIQSELRASGNACFSLLYAKHAGTWQAFVNIVRPGDAIEFRARENSNDYVKLAEIPRGKLNSAFHPHYDGLYADELLVTVIRHNGVNGKQRTILYEMLLCYSICPNNSARAIQQKG